MIVNRYSIPTEHCIFWEDGHSYKHCLLLIYCRFNWCDVFGGMVFILHPMSQSHTPYGIHTRCGVWGDATRRASVCGVGVAWLTSMTLTASCYLIPPVYLCCVVGGGSFCIASFVESIFSCVHTLTSLHTSTLLHQLRSSYCIVSGSCLALQVCETALFIGSRSQAVSCGREGERSLLVASLVQSVFSCVHALTCLHTSHLWIDCPVDSVGILESGSVCTCVDNVCLGRMKYVRM